MTLISASLSLEIIIFSKKDISFLISMERSMRGLEEGWPAVQCC